MVAVLLAAADLAAQWNIDGNRRIDYRIYVRAVSSIDGAGLYDYGTGILRFTYPPVAAVLIWPFHSPDSMHSFPNPRSASACQPLLIPLRKSHCSSVAQLL